MSDFDDREQELSIEARDLHRALTSLKEEIEAVDWDNQRWSVSQDETLRGVLAHNRDEEIEHACKILDRQLNLYFTESFTFRVLEPQAVVAFESA